MRLDAVSARDHRTREKAVRWILIFALVGLASGTGLADEARRLRVEAAVLVQATEKAETAKERRELLEKAHSKLLEIRERYPSEPAQIQFFLYGKRTILLPDHLDQMIAEDHLAALDVGKLREVLGRALSPTLADENGWTDLHYAAALNQAELVRALLNAGAKITARTKDDDQKISDRLKRSLKMLELDQLSQLDRWGGNPLHMAAMNNATGAAETLIDSGADLHARDNGGVDPLGYALWGSAYKAAGFLINRGADINSKDIDGWTNLHGSASVNAREQIEWLLARGADINSKNNDGNAPLHISAEHNAKDAAEALIEGGADVHAENGKYRMPLHIAAEKNAKDVAEALIEGGADVNAKTDRRPETPLHYAAENNSRDVAVMLIDRGANINAKAGHGRTPLQLAERNNAKDVAAVLKQR